MAYYHGNMVQGLSVLSIVRFHAGAVDVYVLPEAFRRGGRQADSGVFCNIGGMVCHGYLARCKLEFYCMGIVKCRGHSAFTGMSSALWKKFHTRFPGMQKNFTYRIFQVVRTVLLMSSLRMLDCYRNVGLTFKMFGTMFTDRNMTVAMKGLLQLGLTAADYAVVAVAVVVVLCVSLKQRSGSIRERLYERTAAVQYLVVFALLFAILIFGAYGIGYDANQFIYTSFRKDCT